MVVLLMASPVLADTISILRNGDHTSITTNSARFAPVSQGDCSHGCSGEFSGPSAGTQLMYPPTVSPFVALFGNPDWPLLQDDIFIRLDVLANAPDILEITYRPNIDNSPDGCVPAIGCVETLSGVVYNVADWFWADGTVDHLTFEWVAAPEPSGAILLVTILIAGCISRIFRNGFRAVR